ncbi:phage tail protein, partial [Chloroflexota bacterium]
MPVQNGNVKLQSSYLEFLPALYRDDEFMGQFLLIFESILKPIENTVDSSSLYFDALMTPEPLLPWLASWIDLTLDPSCPIERRRQLVKAAAELYRWRGTRRGLTEYLRIYTGSTPEISEYIPGMRLEPETRLGINTRLGSSGEGHHFTVTIEL